MTLYVCDLPRGGASNYLWGYPDKLNLMGGWVCNPKSGFWPVFCKDSYYGQVVYCIEPGVHVGTGSTSTSFDEDFWDNYPTHLNPTISPTAVKAHIGRIMQYCWQGNGNLSWNINNSAHANEMAAEIATQLLIWETVVGERDKQFNHVWGSSQGKSNVTQMIRGDHPLRGMIFSYYSKYEKEIQKHLQVPSFLAGNIGWAETYEMKWDGTKYYITLTDTNGVLADYKFTSNNSNLKFSVSGNNLTISSTVPLSGAVPINANKVNHCTRKGIVVWGDGISGGGQQDLVTYGASIDDPAIGFMKLEPPGSIRVVKTAEDGVVEGVDFYKNESSNNQRS